MKRNLIMKRLLTPLFLGIFTIGVGLQFINPPSVDALSGSEFKAGRIIDDAVFYNGNAMNASQIQQFLNAKVPVCDTNGTKMYNSTQTRAQWAAANNRPAPPYICLKNYQQNTPAMESASGLCSGIAGGNKSAAQIINDISKACGINPQVMLVLLQKEQSLITDDWPWPVQYDKATGFSCPDTAPCDPAYAGFFYQVYYAARQFKVYAKYPESYNYRAHRNNRVYYHPDLSRCGSSNVYIENQATASLYIYTPYQPNQAALNNLYGTGDSCSAYGNRNFWRLFNDWFGSTTGTPRFSWSIQAEQLFTDAARTQPISTHTDVLPGKKLYARIVAKNTGNQVWDKSFMRIGTSGPRDRVSAFQDESWISSNRAARMIEETATPGNLATFEFSLTAPYEYQEFREYFNLVAEGRTWLNDLGQYYKLNVYSPTPVYAVSEIQTRTFFDQNYTYPAPASATVKPGTKLYTRVTFRNDSNRNLDRSFTRLGTTEPRDRVSALYDASWPSTNRAAALKETIEPGQTGTFEFIMNAPQQPDTVSEKFGIVLDGIGWRDAEKVTRTVTSSLDVSDTITTSGTLSPGTVIYSNNGKYRLVFQTDGNLVLYSYKRAIWASNTMGKGGKRVIMQTDGNLVMYSPQKAVWASNTDRKGGNRLAVQTDGNLVIYSPEKAVWATGTNGRE